ncbi:TPA: hypothetical protein ACKP33_004220 [Serratia marcescens]|uniref:hypothetical protein n=1 Tax=Serratia sp. Nf2 TaxID=2116540 RepID=UPI000D16AA3B|nr:hypothetical protein [Serratia sp. Nf2]PTA75806.1 hypothetical protein C9411_18715 [Serratia sp. Nf2]
MNADIISFESMLATKQAADWAFWTMIASGVSALAAALGVIFAWRTVASWKQQEKAKVKMDFKRSIFNIINIMLSMPDRFNLELAGRGKKALKLSDNSSIDDRCNVELSHQFDELVKVLSNAQGCWIYCERFFDGTDIEAKWVYSRDLVLDYINGDVEKNVVINSLNNLAEEPFVYG